VIDRLLPAVNKLLSPQGLFYILCVKENKPGVIGLQYEVFFICLFTILDEIMATLERDNISGSVTMQRRAYNEFLMVVRFNHS